MGKTSRELLSEHGRKKCKRSPNPPLSLRTKKVNASCHANTNIKLISNSISNAKQITKTIQNSNKLLNRNCTNSNFLKSSNSNELPP